MRGVSKDGPQTRMRPSFEARVKNGEHLRMTAALAWTFSKKPRSFPRLFVFHERSKPQARVRIRIMKLSKLNSATCIHASDSLR